MPKYFYVKNATATGSSHGSLSEVTQSGTNTSTGWTLGTTAPTSYSLMQYNSKKLASTFGSTPQPNSAPTTNDCWRSETSFLASIASGNWTFRATLSSSLLNASGDGKIIFRLWKSSNATGTSAIEITNGGISSTQWLGVTSSTQKYPYGSISLPEITLNNEYLFFQMAAQIDSAASNTSSDIIIVQPGVQWQANITTPTFHPLQNVYETSFSNRYSGSMTRSLGPVEVVSYSDANLSQTTRYTMRAKYQSSYITWQVNNQPDTTGAQSGVNSADLSDIVVINTKTVII